jgi:hypothetical protein
MTLDQLKRSSNEPEKKEGKGEERRGLQTIKFGDERSNPSRRNVNGPEAAFSFWPGSVALDRFGSPNVAWRCVTVESTEWLFTMYQLLLYLASSTSVPAPGKRGFRSGPSVNPLGRRENLPLVISS